MSKESLKYEWVGEWNGAGRAEDEVATSAHLCATSGRRVSTTYSLVYSLFIPLFIHSISSHFAILIGPRQQIWSRSPNLLPRIKKRFYPLFIQAIASLQECTELRQELQKYIG